MKKLTASCLALGFMVWAACGFGQDTCKEYSFPEKVTAGEKITIKCQFSDKTARRIKVAKLSKPDTSVLEKDATPSETGEVSFDLPNAIVADRYRVSIQRGQEPAVDVPGELRVVNQAEAQV